MPLSARKASPEEDAFSARKLAGQGRFTAFTRVVYLPAKGLRPCKGFYSPVKGLRPCKGFTPQERVYPPSKEFAGCGWLWLVIAGCGGDKREKVLGQRIGN